MPTALSNEEKETIISFDETPADAVIFTYNKRWQQQLERILHLEPVMNNGYGGREYHIPKKRIPLPRAPKRLTAEARRKLGQRLRESRRQKLSNPRRNNAVAMKSRGKKSSEGKNINRKTHQPKNQKNSVKKLL